MHEWKYKLIPVEGDIEDKVMLTSTAEPTYEDLAVIGESIGIERGYFQHVTVWDEGRYKDMFVHEEGRRMGHKFNERASKIYWANSIAHQGKTEEECRKSNYYIVGTAILFEKGV